MPFQTLADLHRHLMAFLGGRRAGEDEAGEETSEEAPPEADSAQASPREEGRWTRARMAVADSLWGEGFVVPGGAEEALRWARPLGLKGESSLLLLGAGGGGVVPPMVHTFKSWVSAYEADPALLAAATQRIAKAGRAISKHTAVELWDPQAPAFRKRSFNHVLAVEALRGAPGRPVPVADLLVALAGAVHSGGHLVLIDVVGANHLDPDDPGVAAWARTEWRVPQVPTIAAMREALTRLKFDVRVAEDITERHIHQVMTGWMALLQTLQAQRPGHERAAAVVAEAELWLRRVRLMQAGQIRLMRFHALGGY